jgi:uncharacterized protein YciI
MFRSWGRAPSPPLVKPTPFVRLLLICFFSFSTYKVPIEQVERVVPAHREFLDQGYGAEKLLVSGRRVPRTGGVIVARVRTREEVDALNHEDPFYKEGIAD